MSTIAPESLVTAADLLEMPDGVRYELIDGQLLERQMGSESSWIGGRLLQLIAIFVEQHDLGWVWPADAGYQCFPGQPKKVRKPDVSFVRHGRLPEERPSTGFETIVPDLVVEVISPNELYTRVEDKVDDFLQAGVRLMWVVNPTTRSVTVYRADGSTAKMREDDRLDGEDVLPGFQPAVRDLFPPRAEADG